jgi:hypothetical protein
MTHWKQLREPPPYLGAWSFELPGQPGKYRRAVFRITKVESARVKSVEKPNGERCILLWFEAKGGPVKKPMVCNATNAKTLESIYGVDVEDWQKQLCEIYVADVTVGRNKTKGLRISSKRPRDFGEAFEEVPFNEETRAQQDAAFARGQEEPGADG